MFRQTRGTDQSPPGKPAEEKSAPAYQEQALTPPGPPGKSGEDPLTPVAILHESRAETDRQAQLKQGIEALVGQVQSLADQCNSLSNALSPLAQDLKGIKAGCLAALTEDQTSIREMAQQIRSLETRQYKEDTLGPIIHEMIGIADGLSELRAVHGPASALGAEQAKELVEAMETSVLALLARHGVQRMPRQVSTLDTRRQRIIRVERVDAPRDNEILSVERDGYEWDGHVLRAQEVAVRKVT